MRCFVAGAGGYLGIPLCLQLAKEGHDVIAFDRYFFGKRPEGHGITVVVGDTRLVTAADLRAVDAVVDLAGLSNDASCEISSSHTNSINLHGARNLINRAVEAKIKRYVYSSSASVYGHGKKLNLTEADHLEPLTHYAKSKVFVEKYLSERKLNYVILRNATVFGLAPRMRFDLAVNAMTARALLDGEIFVMGGGDQIRPFIHVNDVVNTIIWAIENAPDLAGETFNVGCPANQMKIRTLAGKVAYTFNGVKIHTIPDGPDNRSYHLSFDKLKKARPDARYIPIENGVWEIRQALTNGQISFTDPTTWTVGWYRSMLDWDKRLANLKIGELLL